MAEPSSSSGTGAASASAEAIGDEPPLRLAVDVVESDGDWSAFEPVEAAIAQAVAALAAAVDPALLPSEACIALSSDAHVRELNRTYRGQDKATNVLSFPAPEWTATAAPEDGDAPDGGDEPAAAHAADQPRWLGDVVLADATVRGEAEAMGIPMRHHLQHLVVHGLLHLMGFDHETDAEAAEMETLETRVLASIGVPDPYADRDSPPAVPQA